MRLSKSAMLYGRDDKTHAPERMTKHVIKNPPCRVTLLFCRAASFDRPVYA